jgi:hypothetical protein
MPDRDSIELTPSKALDFLGAEQKILVPVVATGCILEVLLARALWLAERAVPRCDAQASARPVTMTLDTANCSELRHYTKEIAHSLVVSNDCRLGGAYLSEMTLRYLIAAAVLFWAAAFLLAPGGNLSIPSSPNLSQTR